MRIESEKPTQLPIDSTFHFGASTRYYILRERPQTAPRSILEELEEEAKTEHGEGGLLGLPESEMELDASVLDLLDMFIPIEWSLITAQLLESNWVQYGTQSAHLNAWYRRWRTQTSNSGQEEKAIHHF